MDTKYKQEMISKYAETDCPETLKQLSETIRTVLLTERAEKPLLLNSPPVDYEDCLFESESEEEEVESELIKHIKTLEFSKGAAYKNTPVQRSVTEVRKTETELKKAVDRPDLAVQSTARLFAINNTIVELNNRKPLENQMAEAINKYDNIYFPDCVLKVNAHLKIEPNMPLWYAFHVGTRSSFGPLNSNELCDLISQRHMNKNSFIRLIDTYLIEGQKPFSFFRVSSLFSANFCSKISISSLASHASYLRGYLTKEVVAEKENEKFKTEKEIKLEAQQKQEQKKKEEVEKKAKEQAKLEETVKKQEEPVVKPKKKDTSDKSKLEEFLSKNSIYSVMDNENVKVESQNVDDLFGEPEKDEVKAPKRKKFKKGQKAKPVEMDLKLKYV